MRRSTTPPSPLAARPDRTHPRASIAVLLGLAACHATEPAPQPAPQPTPTPAPAATPPDPQSAFEPRSAPGEGQQFLATMAGDFVVAKTIHRRSGGDPVTTRGTCHQQMIHGGRFLRSEFVFDADPAREGSGATGTGVIGFDAATGRFTSFWIDSRSTRVSVRQSEVPFDGARIQLVSRSLGAEASPRTSRTVTEFADDGAIVHRQWTAAEDGSERLVMELRLTRDPAAASDSRAPSQR